MPSQQPLFELIKSLSRTQKRYFKVYCGEGGDSKSNYMRLFEAIDKQSVYDEDLIRKQFEGEKFIKHLSSEKRYLIDLILKAMRAYSGEKSVDARLRGSILDIEFLFKQRQFPLALKKIQRATKEAEQLERYPALLELVDYEARIKGLQSSKQLFEIQNELEKRRESYIQAYQKLSALENYRRKFFNYRRQHIQGSADVIEHADALFEEMHRGDLTEDLTFFQKTRYLAAKHYYYNLTGKKEYYFQTSEELITLWDSRPDFIKEETARYKAVLTSYFVVSHAFQQYDGFPAVLARYRSLQTDTQWEKRHEYVTAVVNELLYLIHTFKWKEIEAKIQDIDKKINEVVPNKRYTIYFNIATYCFLMQKWDACHERLKWIMDRKEEINLHLKHLSRLMEIIIYIETTDSNTADYILKSNFRSLQTNNLLKESDKLLKKAFSKYIRLPESERAAYARETFDSLNEAKVAEEILCWWRAKADQKSLQETFESKAHQTVALDA
jgi:hypothetical protein